MTKLEVTTRKQWLPDKGSRFLFSIEYENRVLYSSGPEHKTEWEALVAAQQWLKSLQNAKIVGPGTHLQKALF